jgi:hypothetical protein
MQSFNWNTSADIRISQVYFRRQNIITFQINKRNEQIHTCGGIRI